MERNGNLGQLKGGKNTGTVLAFQSPMDAHDLGFVRQVWCKWLVFLWFGAFWDQFASWCWIRSQLGVLPCALCWWCRNTWQWEWQSHHTSCSIWFIFPFSAFAFGCTPHPKWHTHCEPSLVVWELLCHCHSSGRGRKMNWAWIVGACPLCKWCLT